MIKTMTLGTVREYSRKITPKEVKQFAEVTGDFNKAHFDEDYTKTTIFKKPIVHGMLVGSLFSKIFGTEYPGEGTIYVNQSLTFLKPIYPDEQLTVKVTLKDKNEEKNRAYFTTEIFNEAGKLALTGEAMLMPRKD